MVQVGEIAPDFNLPDTDTKNVSLKELKGSWVVLYFYPKDMTSGCTLEALDFTAAKASFDVEGAIIIGVSADSLQSHVKFREKNSLKHILLSDEEKQTLEKYGVWQTKKQYGHEFKGIVRSTFLIDPHGKVAFTWPKVNVNGHVDEVLMKLRELKK